MLTNIDLWIIGLVAVLGILDAWRQRREQDREDDFKRERMKYGRKNEPI